jgi:dihydropyrimidine dehydrogenase (NAD+) subunit PreA
MKKAYEAGWAGGVMKTAFDNVDIHIPAAYMFAVTKSTYGNCDNVSGHPLDRVCSEIKKLVTEYPDRLTLASTGGPVSGNDEEDMKVWQSNTKKLESAGVMGVEYSLSCPQGGDGTKGDIVSQDAELTAKIIDWVMQVSDANVPKLFKLTAAVTSIYPIMTAIKEVFDKYPGKKAGVTLANTFPALSFRKGNKENWEEGVVIGLSGEGVIPISNLTLANVARHGISVSGNGGPMDYKAAADFLALGAKTVQFCTIVMKYGYGIIDELNSGLSYLLKERGLNSVDELIGYAFPHPITGFMELTPVKKISAVNKDLCEHCGNCERCPYLAIELDGKKVPVTDASRCIGCTICVQKCFAGALYMRERTEVEMSVLNEA